MVPDISQKVLIQALREMEDGVVVADGSRQFARPHHLGASGSPQSCDAHHDVTASRQRPVARKPSTAEAPTPSASAALKSGSDAPGFSPGAAQQLRWAASEAAANTSAPVATSESAIGAAGDSVHWGGSPVDSEGGGRMNKAEHPCPRTAKVVASATRRKRRVPLAGCIVESLGMTIPPSRPTRPAPAIHFPSLADLRTSAAAAEPRRCSRGSPSHRPMCASLAALCSCCRSPGRRHRQGVPPFAGTRKISQLRSSARSNEIHFPSGDHFGEVQRPGTSTSC